MEVSRLFNIDPIGVGTPYVESLPSYIKRLAEAHSVYPGILLKNEIFPQISGFQLNQAFSKYKELLLSISSVTVKDLIRVLEVKTNNCTIHNLSLSKLSRYIDSKNIFRDYSAWCPLCYEESRQNSEPVYEQLIWAIKDIEICGKHGSQLYHICPKCHKKSNHYSSFGRVGYCDHCKYWLGLNVLNGNSHEVNNWDFWVLDNIGSILSDIPKISLSAKSCMSKNIIEILNFTGLSQTKLGKEISVSQGSILRWATQNIKPRLPSVLLLGYKFGLPISKLLFEEIDSNNIIINNINVAPNIKRPKVNLKQIQQSLKKAIVSTDLVSVYMLCKQCGVNIGTIRRHFPREFNLLKQKNKRQQEEKAHEREKTIREAMISLNKRGIFPNINRVMSEIGKRVIDTERYRKVWENTLCELGYTDKTGFV